MPAMTEDLLLSQKEVRELPIFKTSRVVVNHYSNGDPYGQIQASFGDSNAGMGSDELSLANTS